MSLLRWFALALMLLLQVVPQAVAAQEANSTPEADQTLPLAAVQREFEVSGITLLGPAQVNAIVMIYETPDQAIAGLPYMMNFYRDQMESSGSANLREASTIKLGEEREAYAGSITAGDTEGQAGMFGWREGNRIYILIDVGLAGDMLTPIFDLGESLSGRPLPDTAVTPASSPGEMSRGGVYELLPTLADMPPGWVFNEDTDMLAQSTAATPEP